MPTFVAGAASGVLASLAFPPLDLGLLAFVALLPMLARLEAIAEKNAPLRAFWKDAFLLGFSQGFAYFLALLWWIVLLDAPALTIPWVRYPGTGLVVAYLALYFGAFAVGCAWVRARTRVPLALVAPALWVVTDVARGYWELGFPWGHLGYSQVRVLPALQMASVTGIHGVTAWIVAVNALLLGAWRAGCVRPVSVAAAAVVLLVPMSLGALRLRGDSAGATARVALVQPDIPNTEKWKSELREEHFENLADLSRQGAERGASLVVWPETAAPTYLLRDGTWRPWMEDLAREIAVPLFVGFPDYQVVKDERGRRVTYTNSGALFSSDGELAGRMDKMELVPFGERMPFSSQFDFMARLDFGEADFIEGKGPVMLDPGGWIFGGLVCFEAIYPWLCRRHALAGAEMLVNITNDSWFGAGSGARQHADMAVFRCVETGCGMARAANSGISMAVDPLGRSFQETALFTRDLVVVDVPLRRGVTWFVRTGEWVLPLAAAASTAFLGLAFARRRREV